MSLVQKIDLLTGRIAGEFRTVKTQAFGSATGDASALQTTAKNLVGAVNELKAGIDAAYTAAETDAAISAAIDGVLSGAPGALDTLNELAAALGDDANFAATVTAQLALKAATSDVNAALELKADKNGVYTIAQANAAIASATAGLALRDKVLNLQAPVSPSTTAVINPAIAGIGNVNGFVVNLSFGNFDEVGPILIDNKQQLNIQGPPAATTTAVTVKNGLTIQNSNGVRITRVQFEGNSSISSRAGNGLHFQHVQFMGNLTLGGTGGFMMFTDCEIGGDLTISPSFAGVVYFIRCSFGKSNGVYTMGQTSAQQVIVSDCSGVSNGGFTRASYSGTITYKNGTQALFNNNVAISTLGAASGQVLKFNGTAFVPAADNTPDVNKAYVDAAVAAAAGNSTAAVNALANSVYTKAQTDTIVSTAVNDLINAAPGTLDTLGEIAAVIADDQNAAAALAQVVAGKANAADVYTKAEVDGIVETATEDLFSKNGGTVTGAFVVAGLEGVEPLFEVNPSLGTMYMVNTDGSGGNFEAGPGFVSLVGANGTNSVMASEGQITLSIAGKVGVPQEPGHVTTKYYVDSMVEGAVTGLTQELETAVSGLNLAVGDATTDFVASFEGALTYVAPVGGGSLNAGGFDPGAGPIGPAP